MVCTMAKVMAMKSSWATKELEGGAGREGSCDTSCHSESNVFFTQRATYSQCFSLKMLICLTSFRLFCQRHYSLGLALVIPSSDPSVRVTLLEQFSLFSPLLSWPRTIISGRLLVLLQKELLPVRHCLCAGQLTCDPMFSPVSHVSTCFPMFSAIFTCFPMFFRWFHRLPPPVGHWLWLDILLLAKAVREQRRVWVWAAEAPNIPLSFCKLLHSPTISPTKTLSSSLGWTKDGG